MPPRAREYRFRKPEPNDVEAIYAYRNDDSVTSTVGGFSIGMSRQDVLDWIEHHRKGRDMVWAIARESDDVCVGHGGFYNIDARRGRGELGMALATSEHGRGVGGRCLGALVDYGFRSLRLHRQETFNLALNPKIVTIKERLGFKLEGVMREAQWRDRTWVDIMVMAILEQDWDGVPEHYR